MKLEDFTKIKTTQEEYVVVHDFSHTTEKSELTLSDIIHMCEVDAAQFLIRKPK